MKKEDYLREKIHPFDPSQVNSVEEALVALQGCSFQGRNLGRALEVLTNMVKTEDTFKVLTLAGAMVPAGMDEVICQMIEKRIIDAIVSTGANITHSFLNGIEEKDAQAHYLGSSQVDDRELYHYRINRIYDTFLPEEEYIHGENKMLEIIKEEWNPQESLIITPSEFFKGLGKHIKGRCFVSVAARNNVPIFCGATSDSELGLNLMIYRKQYGIHIILDEIADIDRFGSLIKKHKHSGTIIIGGGVPRNWAQQIFPYLDQAEKLGLEQGIFNGYDFSVRFHSAVVYDGGLSGCTINESISWGKYKKNARHQSVWGDATVYFPLLITALFQRLENEKLEEN